MKPRAFHVRPDRKMALSSLFLAAIALVLGLGALRHPGAETLPVFLASALLAGAGLWVTFRGALPWSGPALVASDEGLRFWPRRRTSVFMPWDHLRSIGSDMSDNSLVFHPIEPARYERPYLIWLKRPPYVPQAIRTRDGGYFLGVVDQYWEGMREKPGEGCR